MKDVLIFGHKNPDTDTICSSLVKEILNEKNGWHNTKAVRLGKLNKETEYVLKYIGIEEPELIEKVEEGQEVILIDHNEFNQSVEGIENAKILAVIDHHKIANFETSYPLYYTARPYGCTSTILFEEFKRLGHIIERKEAILMLSAIISDTLLLKSPTTTENDKIAVKELAKIAEIDEEKYGLDMLKAGTDLSDYTEEELINIDSKNSEANGVNMQVAQINTASIDDVLKKQEKIELAMQNFIDKNNIDIFMLLITDIINSNSEAIVLGSKAEIAKKAFGMEIENNRMFLEGVVSRKKQVFPVLIENV